MMDSRRMPFPYWATICGLLTCLFAFLSVSAYMSGSNQEIVIHASTTSVVLLSYKVSLISVRRQLRNSLSHIAMSLYHMRHSRRQMDRQIDIHNHSIGAHFVLDSYKNRAMRSLWEYAELNYIMYSFELYIVNKFFSTSIPCRKSTILFFIF